MTSEDRIRILCTGSVVLNHMLQKHPGLVDPALSRAAAPDRKASSQRRAEPASFVRSGYDYAHEVSCRDFLTGLKGIG